MQFVDKVIAGIAPHYAIRRLQARSAIKGYYDAAKNTRLRKIRMGRDSPDAIVQMGAEKLRESARDLDRNLDIAKNALGVLVANTVGLGIVPDPQIKTVSGDLAKSVNDAVKSLWLDWVKYPEVTGDYDYYSAQRLAARTWFRDGEVLTQLLSGSIGMLDHYSKVPFSLELLEPDYLPMDYNDPNKNIVQGVQKNAWGRAKAYHIYKINPAESGIAINSTKRIRAEKIIHLKMMDRIRQTRGISIFASVMIRLDDIKNIESAERVAARIAASMSGYIKKGSPDMYIPPDGGSEDREMEMASGMIFDDLIVGEEIGTIASNRPNNALIPFRESQLRAASGGLGTSFSSLAKNYDGTYSAQRQELVEQYIHYGIIWSVFVSRFCQPIYERFIDTAITAGLLTLDDDIDKDTIYLAEHSRPSMPWIDPAKEMAGIEKEISLNLTSRSQVIRRKNGDPNEVMKKIAEERQAYQDLGIELDLMPSKDEPPDKDSEPTPVKTNTKNTISNPQLAGFFMGEK